MKARFSGLKFLIHLIERSKCLEKDESKSILFNGHNLKTLYERNIKVLNDIIINYEKNNTIIDKKYENTSGLIDGDVGYTNYKKRNCNT